MRGEHELLKPTQTPASGVCVGCGDKHCGNLTPAIAGVFDLLCPACLEEKRMINEKKFYPKKKRK